MAKIRLIIDETKIGFEMLVKRKSKPHPQSLSKGEGGQTKNFNSAVELTNQIWIMPNKYSWLKW